MPTQTIDIELDQYSLEDLRKLQSIIPSEIAKREQANKESALEKLKAEAKNLGYTLEELLEDNVGHSRKSRKAATKKYRNPDDKTQTWTGRGRRPKWVDAYLDSGKSLEDLEI